MTIHLHTHHTVNKNRGEYLEKLDRNGNKKYFLTKYIQTSIITK